jgi:NAD(P)-dependent dehydrogenase (short-subunit alcohol dehydrogenase family)
MIDKKAILITGTSTGIGKACALHLDTLGYKVYAGVRKAIDGENLQKEASGNLTPLLLDVTDTDSIATAAGFIKQDNDGELAGLINNAGIGRGGVVEVTPMTEIRRVLEINLIGLIAVTQAFIPLLRPAQGRIINVGSTSSFLAFPGAGIYSASKFAVRAISDSLRLELKPFSMSVILIAPGAVESAIWEKGVEYKKELRQTVSPELAELYAPLRRFGEKLQEVVKKIPASEVAKQVEKALTVKKPKAYYLVGGDAKGAAKVARLPKALLDWLILKRIQKIGQ